MHRRRCIILYLSLPIIYSTVYVMLLGFAHEHVHDNLYSRFELSLLNYLSSSVGRASAENTEDSEFKLV